METSMHSPEEAAADIAYRFKLALHTIREAGAAEQEGDIRGGSIYYYSTGHHSQGEHIFALGRVCGGRAGAHRCQGGRQGHRSEPSPHNISNPFHNDPPLCATTLLASLARTLAS